VLDASLQMIWGLARYACVCVCVCVCVLSVLLLDRIDSMSISLNNM